VRPYVALLRARFRTLLSYRAAAIAGLVTQWVFGFIMISVLMAFYNDTSAEQPMTLAQTITYTWVGQALLGIISWNIDRDIGDSVRTGAVAYDLVRPIGMYAHWYVRALALKTAPTLMKSIPMFLIATFVLPAPYAMRWPDLPMLAAFAVALLFAVLLSASITALMQATLFWTVTGDGVSRIVPALVIILGGLGMPLPLFPDWMQKALMIQPFAGVMSAPALLFCGIAPLGVLPVYLLQIFWTLAFVMLGRLLLQRGMRRLTVVGG